MKSSIALGVCGLAVIPWFSPTGVRAAPLSYGGQYDIGALLDDARARHDFSKVDAVVLLEEQDVELSPDCGRRTTVHRIVWVATDLASGVYADLRVPYPADRATFAVIALRTWRDGQWWPAEEGVSPTAVVETLPGELASAADYSDAREMMLLHDGVELPCVVETRYSITESDRREHEADGVWVFQQADPVMRAILRVTIPAGQRLHHVEWNGAPEPKVEGETPDAVSYVWRMDQVARAPRPLTSDPVADLPSAAWSTWESWTTLGRTLSARVESALAVSAELQDSVSAALVRESDDRGRVAAIAQRVADWTREVSYSHERFWSLAPRTAQRTWESAYGHTLDRAVLAMALFRAAGFHAQLCLAGPRADDAMLAVPALAWFRDTRVDVSAPDGKRGYRAFLDLGHGGLRPGSATSEFARRMIWIPGEDARIAASPAEGSLAIVLTLEPADEGRWSGSGYVRAAGQLAPYADMCGIGTEANECLSSLASVLKDVEITDHSVAVLEPEEIVAGFSLTHPAIETDDHDRLPISIGDPDGGILAQLPSDVRLPEVHRETPVTLLCPLEQTIEVRVKTGDREVIYAPTPSSLENEAGRQAVSVENDGTWLRVKRTLALSEPVVAAEAWPALRALLLADASERNRTILLGQAASHAEGGDR